MKRTLSVVLASLMLCSLLSCANESSPPPPQNDTSTDVEETTAAETTTEETTAPETELNYADILPKKKFENATYTTAAKTNTTYAELAAYELVSAGENGEVINDTVFKRNRSIEEQYGVVLKEYRIKDLKGTVEKSVAAGDGGYQMALGGWSDMAKLAVAGDFRDWSRMEHIDITKPWYMQEVRKGTAIGDRVYLELNYTPYVSILYTHCIYFNKDSIEANKLTSPYQLVDEGKWTIDKMIEMANGANRDLNGDGTMDKSDYYGVLVSAGGTMVFTYAFENPTVSISKDGKVSMDLHTDKFSRSIDKVLQLCSKENAYFAPKSAEEPELAQRFANGGGLFYFGFMSDSLARLRDTDVNFGMVTYPKYDEKQENYWTKVGGNAFVMGIPTICGDLEMVGIVTEAQAIESYKNVRPAVYDQALAFKGLRDEESYKSYEMIIENIVLDFGQLFRMGKNAYIQMLQTCVGNGQNTLASLNAELEEEYRLHYQTAVDALASHPH